MRLVLLDTNTLLLWLVGNVRPESIGGKRLERFDHFDFSRLRALLDGPLVHVTLPNILTEVSNLIGSGRQSLGNDIQEAFEVYCRSASETYLLSANVVATEEVRSLGLTDAAIFMMRGHGVEVFTVDFHLGNRLAEVGIKVINLMHFKTPYR